MIFSYLFLVPQESDLSTVLDGYITMFACICFPFLGLELRFVGVNGGFPHSPGSMGSGHFFYTIVSRLGFCCKFGPLASLLGVRSPRVRTIVCNSLRLEHTTYDFTMPEGPFRKASLVTSRQERKQPLYFIPMQHVIFIIGKL